MPIIKRRLFVISLRGLMVAIVILGAFLGWRVNRANIQRKAVAEVVKAGGFVNYDFAYENGQTKSTTTPWTPDWFRRAVGEEYFQEVTTISFRVPGGEDPVPPPRVTDDTLAALGQLDRLEDLRLWKMPVTDAGVPHLSGLSRLRNLELYQCPAVTDTGLSHLRTLTNLRTLHLYRTSVTGTGLAALSGNQSLESLSLSESNLTDAGLAQIGRHWKNSLQTLSFDNCPGVSDTGTAHLSGMVRLRSLYFYGTPITDAGLAHIAGLTDLENLGISSPITDAGLAHLRGMTRLHVLYLYDNPKVTDAGLAPLEGMTELVRIGLDNTRVTDTGLVHLRGLKKLQSLSVDLTDVSDEALAALRAELPSLTNVSNKKRPAAAK